MFYFYADKNKNLLVDTGQAQLQSKRLFADLWSAQQKKHRHLFIVDTDALPATDEGTKIAEESLHEALNGDISKTLSVPIEAIRNVSPYLPPSEVAAGGGIVTKVKNGKLCVLVIFRRGVWDLPKGKLTRGETVRECALREVKEETGIKDLSIVQPLDVTVHGYAEDDLFRVKTTHWFEMRTSDEIFTPEIREGIEAVKWMRWKKARKKIGFKIFRKLLGRTRPLIATAERE